MQMEKEPSSRAITWLLAIALGLLVAGMLDEPGGFVVGALLGIALAQVLHLRGRTRALHQQLQALKAAGEIRRAPEAAPPVQPVTAATAVVAETVVAAPAPTPSPQPTLAAAREWEPPPRPAAPAEPSPLDRAVGEFIAWLRRGNPLARIGIVILFFGGAFLAKYAADHSLFPIELRFISIALGAFALLIVGWRLREKRGVYAQLLQGGGIAGLYLTVFAAMKLYQLLPLGLAFSLMVVIAVAGAILAVAQNALSLAVIAAAGGFLAPILVSTGSGNHVALFSYYAVLNVGVFVVAWFRTWRVLNVLGFVFTFTITGMWRASGYEPADLASAASFLILFFLMYVAISILNCVRQPPDLKGYVSGSLVFGLPVVAFTLHATLVSHIAYALAWSALALGLFYLLLGWILFLTRRDSFRLLVEAFAALGVIFASLAIPLAFDTRTTAAMWAVEGAGLLWLGVRQQRRLARVFGTLLQLGAGVGFLIGLAALHSDRPILNTEYLGAVMLAVSGLLSSYWLHRNRDRRAGYETGAEIVYALWGAAWWLFGGLQQIDRFVSACDFGAALVYVAVTAALLGWIGRRKDWPQPQFIAIYLPAVATLPALVYSSDTAHPFAHWGAVGWIALFGAHYGALFPADRRAPPPPGLAWLHAGAGWALALIIAWESHWQVDRQASGVWPQLPWGLAPALLLAVIARRVPILSWPIARHLNTYRLHTALPLLAAVCLWIAAINLTSSGDSSWLPYIPLLNPLDVSVALSFAAGALWWTSLDDSQRARLAGIDPRVPIAIAAGLVFLWLNAALIRALHHNWGAPITAYGIMHSTLVQAALSIFWGVLGFAAMTLAARQKWRIVWLVGVSLMIVVVAKLFLVDLSNSGTVARIASFLTVGALLLVTGYLAPLPPRKTSDA